MIKIGKPWAPISRVLDETVSFAMAFLLHLIKDFHKLCYQKVDFLNFSLYTVVRS